MDSHGSFSAQPSDGTTPPFPIRFHSDWNLPWYDYWAGVAWTCACSRTRYTDYSDYNLRWKSLGSTVHRRCHCQICLGFISSARTRREAHPDSGSGWSLSEFYVLWSVGELWLSSLFLQVPCQPSR